LFNGWQHNGGNERCEPTGLLLGDNKVGDAG
jgi:hypothetical protein